MFGLFMVLTFTGTLSVATAGKEEVRTMLVTAIGCNTCHAVHGKWHMMGVSLTGGGALDWFRDRLCNELGSKTTGACSRYSLTCRDSFFGNGGRRLA